MSMSSKALHRGKHQCYRKNCQGHSKDYDNYMHELPRPKSKIKPQKTSRSTHSLHEKGKCNKNKRENPPQISQEFSRERAELEEVRKQNDNLTEVLADRNLKIGELKGRLKDTEGRLKSYEQRLLQYQQMINENNRPTSPITAQPPNQALFQQFKEQARLLEQSQRASVETMQKYRLLDEEFQGYRIESERKMTALVRENEQLKVVEDSAFKDYDEEISSLKKQLHRLSEHQHSPTPFTKTEGETEILKSSHRELMAEKEELLCQLQQKERRQRELTSNLEAINAKVERWGEQYKVMVAERRKLQEDYDALQAKFEQKRIKHSAEKEEWGEIFQELMREVEKLKRQVSRLERSNHKLVNIYTEQED